MKATLRVSTGATIVVWREEETYHSRLADTLGEAQICLGIDLFEVIAELAGLDLEVAAQGAEAIELADRAQRLLDDEDPGPRKGDDVDASSSCG